MVLRDIQIYIWSKKGEHGQEFLRDVSSMIPLIMEHQSFVWGRNDEMRGERTRSTSSLVVYTLQGTNISPKNGILKMIFLFPRWDMLVPWRVIYIQIFIVTKKSKLWLP